MGSTHFLFGLETTKVGLETDSWGLIVSLFYFILFLYSPYLIPPHSLTAVALHRAELALERDHGAPPALRRPSFAAASARPLASAPLAALAPPPNGDRSPHPREQGRLRFFPYIPRLLRATTQHAGSLAAQWGPEPSSEVLDLGLLLSKSTNKISHAFKS